ncbi:HNH endonuclease signature motif containing protein [Nocardioides jensenii]|uniref:HNH endonuclease signature motif containing protein n=1 Tax=Nocardioides jensenii TaxID=1843 RepID=UPI000835057A|nr:HNH endonuclease signature motif containing protein [Nocardioides jensenii]
MTASDVVSELLKRLDADLGDLSALPLTPLDDDQVSALLQTCTAIGDRLTHATSRVAVEAHHRALGDKVGARHTSNWWAKHSRLTKSDAARRLDLARELDDPFFEPVATALADGQIHADHAHVMVKAIADLPSDLAPESRAKARDILLDDARSFDADELRQIGRHLLDVIDPERAEAEEGKRLQDEEDKANATARVTFSNDGHGRVHGRFILPATQGELFRNQLLALADPRRDLPGSSADGPAGSGTNSPRRDGALITPERMGHALMELIEMFPADKLPTHAASSVAIVITIDIAQLLSDSGFGVLATGERITAGEVRRLACRAGIIPGILDGPSEVLDLGRLRRLFSTAQFRPLALRDQGCTAVGCGMPAGVCHAHHDTAWSAGGATDVSNGRLLCPHHHRLIHHRGYRHSIGADNKVSFRKIT